jgi:hypothetical protein
VGGEAPPCACGARRLVRGEAAAGSQASDPGLELRAHGGAEDGQLGLQRAVEARAVGGRGPNIEYLYNTVAHLAELGIADPDLEWLVARVRRLAEAGSAA